MMDKPAKALTEVDRKVEEAMREMDQRSEGMTEALDKLASLFPGGELLAESTPAVFVVTVAEEVERLRAAAEDFNRQRQEAQTQVRLLTAVLADTPENVNWLAERLVDGADAIEADAAERDVKFILAALRARVDLPDPPIEDLPEGEDTP